MPNKNFQTESIGLSDVGLFRQRNEDAWAQLSDKPFFVLADGMGGHQGGHVAARLAVETLTSLVREEVKPLDASEAKKLLMTGILNACDEVRRVGALDETLTGMGSTVCCLYLVGNQMVWGNLGDSRVYHMREGKLSQISDDHSLIGNLVRTGQLSPQEAERHPLSHIITQAVGTEKEVHPDVGQVEVQKGDLFMLCSDGLSDYVPHKEIEALLREERPLPEKCQRLIDIACKVGGEDNITVVLVAIP